MSKIVKLSNIVTEQSQKLSGLLDILDNRLKESIPTLSTESKVDLYTKVSDAKSKSLLSVTEWRPDHPNPELDKMKASIPPQANSYELTCINNVAFGNKSFRPGDKIIGNVANDYKNLSFSFTSQQYRTPQLLQYFRPEIPDDKSIKIKTDYNEYILWKKGSRYYILDKNGVVMEQEAWTVNSYRDLK